MSELASISHSLDMVPTVDTDQLRLAVARALAAVAREAAPLGAGPYGSMTGETAARMAAAIAHAFPAEDSKGEQLLKGLIWRGIFAFSDVVTDTRFMAFGGGDEAQIRVGTALLDAVARIPMPFGGDVPVDAIYASACDIAVRDDRPIEMTTIIEVRRSPAAQPG